MRKAIIDGVNSYSAGPLHDDITLILEEIRCPVLLASRAQV
jgi:hypothetical protein